MENRIMNRDFRTGKLPQRNPRKQVAVGGLLLVLVLAASIVTSGHAEPGDVLKLAVPIISEPPPQVRELRDGDATVATQTGALQYSFPIAVPPGRRGLQPRLALSYSSQGGTYGGIAAGWTLNVPEIRLDPSESVLAVSQGNSVKRFVSTMAGGHRLMPVTEPTSVAADVVATFRAEDDSSYARYERLPDNRWRVRTHDGMVYYFGDPDHMVGPPEERRAPLTRMVDPFGNTVHYFWDADTYVRPGVDEPGTVMVYHRYLTSVEYTDDATEGGLEPFARVVFDWASPVYCPSAGLPKGARFSMRDQEAEWEGARQLNAIRTEVVRSGAWSAQRTITLGYDAESSRCDQPHGSLRLLTAIQETAFDAAGTPTTLPAISFGYGPLMRTFGTPSPFALQGELYSGNPHSLSQTAVTVPRLDSMLLDLNGDGRVDRLRAAGLSNGPCSFILDRNTGFGFVPGVPQPFPIPSFFGLGEGQLDERCSLLGYASEYDLKHSPDHPPKVLHPGHLFAYRFLDMDADGLPDLVTALHTDLTFYDPNTDSTFLTTWGLSPTCEPAAENACRRLTPAALKSALHCAGAGGGEICEFEKRALDAALDAAAPIGCDDLKLVPVAAGINRRTPFKHCGTYPWRWYKNNGDGQFDYGAPHLTLSPIPLEPSGGETGYGGGYSLASQLHAIIDLDGDGYLDAVAEYAPDRNNDGGLEPSPGGWFVWRGDGQGNFLPRPDGRPYLWYAPTPMGGVGTTPNSVTTRIQLLDMNGDGLVDLVEQQINSIVRTYFNNGAGFRLGVPQRGGVVGPAELRPEINTTGLSHVFGPQLTPTRETRIGPFDIDGDSRIDFFVRRPTLQPPDPVDMHMTDGAGHSTLPVPLPPSTAVSRFHQIIQFAVGGSWFQNQDALDIDGDGVVDLVSLDPERGWIILTDQKDGKPNRLLTRIDNGAGLTTEVSYAALTDRSAHLSPRQPGIPQHLWLVRQLRTTNAHVATWPGDPSVLPSDVATTTYSYGPPVWNQDNRGKYGFRGFTEVHTRAPRGAMTVQKYSYDVDWSGRLTETAEYPAGGSSFDPHLDPVDSIEQVTYMPRTLFGGAARSFVVTDQRSYTCRRGQTRAQCLDPASDSAVLQKRTTWTAYPLNSTAPLLWAPTEVRKTRAVNALSLGDKRESVVNHHSFGQDRYRLHRGVTRFHEARLNPEGQVAWEKYAEHIEDLDPTFRSVSHKRDWLGSRYTQEHFQYYPTGQLKQVKRPQQSHVGTDKVVRFEYDPNGVYVTKTTNELDHVVYTSYDVGTGALLSTRGPNGTNCETVGAGTCTERQTRVDGFGRPLQQLVTVDGADDRYFLRLAGQTTYFDSEAPPRVRTQRSLHLDADNADFVRTDTTFDGYGRVLTETDFNQTGQSEDRAVLRYDAQGNLVLFETTNPAGASPASVVYRFTYDSLNRLETATRPGGAGFAVARDGLVKTRTETIGPDAAPGQPQAMTRTTRDVFGRLILIEEKIEESTFAHTSYDYDGFDNLVRVVSADGNTTTLTYDSLGRRTAITRGGRTWRYEYDDNGNLVREIAPHLGTNAAPYTTSIEYDDLDRPILRLTGVRDLSPTDLAEMGHGPTLYTYDQGRNGVGRLTGVSMRAGPLPSSPQWFSVSRAYDARGLLTGETRAFDLGAVLGASGLTDTRTVERRYNGLGQVTDEWHGDATSVADATHTTAAYDQRGNPISLVWHRGGVPTTLITLTRNASGLITQSMSALAGQPLEHIEQSWERDVLGRMLTHDVQIKPTGQGKTRLSREAMTYFDTDDVATLGSERAGLPTHNFAFKYDHRHQLVNAQNDQGYSAGFTYSPGGLLTSANIDVPDGAPEASDRNVTYDYTNPTPSNFTASPDPEAINRLTNATGGETFADYDYDLSGNVIIRAETGGIYSFLYDGDDQQRRAIAPNTERELYYYDENGQRMLAVTRSVDGAIQRVRFWYGALEVRYTGTGAVERTWVHLGLGTPIARVERVGAAAPTLEYQFGSNLGHLLGAISEGATTLSTAFVYGPFGEILAESGLAADHTRRFNGKERDLLSGLNYYGFRYYDPLSLQWTQADPLYRFAPELAYDQPRRVGLYGFVLNNPLRYVDPNGLKDKPAPDAGPPPDAGDPDLPLCGDVAGPEECVPGDELEDDPLKPAESDWDLVEIVSDLLTAVPCVLMGCNSANAPKLGEAGLPRKSLTEEVVGYSTFVVGGAVGGAVGGVAGRVAGRAVGGVTGRVASRLRTGGAAISETASSFGPRSLGAAQSILQRGKHTITNKTARELNKLTGRNLSRREWGRVVERLKKANSVPNDFHPIITHAGEYLDHAGNVIDYISDYLP
jgi:RHS repeat-associated protein